MWGVGEHVDGLDGCDAVVGIEVVQVAGLGGGIARDVDDATGSGIENRLDDIGVHAGTGRIGDDDVRASVLGDKLVGEYVLHIAGIEQGVGDAVDVGVDLGILDGLGDVFDANDLTGLTGHEIGDGACAGREVVDQR